MVAPADFKPDEDVVSVLIAGVPSLVSSPTRNCFAGPVEAYDKQSSPGIRLPHKAVFVTATGGLPSRRLKGNVLGDTDERHPMLNVLIRSSSKGVPTAFRDGQELARQVFDAIHHNPPSGYCEAVSINSHPSYLGRDDDGHHEWVLIVQLTVDVV